MLEYLRNAADKPVAKILIGILAFSFVGWGVAEWIFGGGVGDNTLVRVGGEKVTVGQFTQKRSQEMAQLTRDQQRAIYADKAASAEFSTKILGMLTTQQMAENRAEDLGFVVTDRQVAHEIRSFPEFQQGGQFSTVLFDAVLMNSGYSEADFARVLRGQVLRSMVLGAVGVPVPVPNFAVMADYTARYAKRDIEYATVKYSDFKVGTPTEEQLRDFYAQNPHVIPEFRTVSYVMVPAAMDKPDEYEAGLKVAQSVEDDVIGGETLRAAATKHKAKFVELGAFSRDKRPVDTVLTDSVMNTLFDMAEGTETELLETKQGFVLARVDQVVPAHNAEFDAVRGNLAADWVRAEQKKQAYVRANEILTAAKDGDSAGMQKATVSRGSGAAAEVLSAAFNNEIGDVGIAPGTDAFYVVRVNAQAIPAVDSAKMADVRKERVTMAGREMTDDYNSFLQRQYPIKVNKKVFNKIFAE